MSISPEQPAQPAADTRDAFPNIPPLELAITNERGTTEFARINRAIAIEYRRLVAAKETT